MTNESILGLELNRSDSAEQTPRKPSDETVDVRLNTLRETVLQLLDEVESLAISTGGHQARGSFFRRSKTV
jgi:hypothetical protein